MRGWGLSPGRNIKAIVDGACAAMQQGVRTADLVTAAGRLEMLLGLEPDHVLELVLAPGAPLGLAKRLLTLDGADQVRVTPDDDRCLGAEVIAVERSGQPRVAVDVYATRAV